MSEITIGQKVRPWQTPNFVVLEMPSRPRQEGLHEAPSMHVRDVDAETLSAQCDRFRADIFAKAGKDDPRPVEPA